MCVRVLKLPLADAPSSSRTHRVYRLVFGHTLTLALLETLTKHSQTHIYLLLFFSHIFFASCFCVRLHNFPFYILTFISIIISLCVWGEIRFFFDVVVVAPRFASGCFAYVLLMVMFPFDASALVLPTSHACKSEGSWWVEEKKKHVKWNMRVKLFWNVCNEWHNAENTWNITEKPKKEKCVCVNTRHKSSVIICNPAAAATAAAPADRSWKIIRHIFHRQPKKCMNNSLQRLMMLARARPFAHTHIAYPRYNWHTLS